MSSYSLKKIGLKETKFSLPSIDFRPSDKVEILIDRKHFEPNEDGDFEINVSVEIKPSNLENSLLKVTYFGFFSKSEGQDEVLKFKDFAVKNGPAIIYPYVRQFVRSLSLEAGFNPIILPVVNFITLGNEKNSEK